MIEWNAADATYIRTVFNQPTGLKFLALVKAGIPKIRATKLEEVSVEALKKQGAEDLYTHIETMIEGPPPELREGVDIVDLTIEGD